MNIYKDKVANAESSREESTRVMQENKNDNAVQSILILSQN